MLTKFKQLLWRLWQKIRECSIWAIVLGELIYWSPLIVLGVMGILTGGPQFWAMFAAVYAFWVWLLPAIPIQILFIFIINKIIRRFFP